MHEVDDRPRELYIRTAPDDDDRVRLTVQDSGVGLPRAAGDKIFGAFQSTKSGGMGIGLFISRSIVARHGGRIWATPNAGPGTTFAFSLPSDSDGEAAGMGKA
jgi:hypothetical protein